LTKCSLHRLDFRLNHSIVGWTGFRKKAASDPLGVGQPADRTVASTMVFTRSDVFMPRKLQSLFSDGSERRARRHHTIG
jgi:hypothetical protein